MVFVSNFVLARFLGLCPFIGVTKRTDSAFGMGMAVTFVMTLASAVTWFIFRFVLLSGAEGGSNIFAGLIGANQSLTPVLKTVSYILVIATLVQFVEMFLKKSVPSLYKSLGIFLPLITTNCAVLGVALLNTTETKEVLSFPAATFQGFCAGLGFLVVMILMSGIRERLEALPLPKALQGVPIALVCTALMALAFTGFAGLIQAG
jgi:electron transport complex protein RnfA